MIGALDRVAGPEARARLRGNAVSLIAEGVLTGIGFAILVPLLRHLLTGDLAAAGLWLTVEMAVIALYAALRLKTQLAGYRTSIWLGRILFRRLALHIAQLPLGWFNADRVAQIGRLASQGVINVIGVPAHMLRPVITALVTPATVLVLMFVFDWRLALAMLISVPAIALVFRRNGDLVQRQEHDLNAAAVEAAGRMIEFAQSQAVLRSCSRDGDDLGALDRALVRQFDVTRKLIHSVGRGLLSFILVLQIALTLVLLFGVSLALGGDIDAAELVALLVLLVRYVEPLIVAADLEGVLRMSRNNLQRMDTLLAVAPLPEPESDRSTQPRDSSVVFDAVGFAYDDSPVLEDVSFTVPHHSMTAIVGPSGAGKTTILRLIARFWDVADGAVRIGGVDVRDMAGEDLMQHISIVFQDVYLFDGTIAENIALGRERASAADIERAARLACVDEIAARLPDGLASRVGEGGSALSGGERQRVSIARAILKDAPIILLDEATAALDPINEAAVQQALQALTKDKTLVVVAHRLQTVRAADQILVLRDGRVAERGNHDALLSLDGDYAAFWKERHRAGGWRLGPAELRKSDEMRE